MQKAASASQFIYLKHHTELCYGPIMPWLMIAATLLHVPVLYFIRDGKTTAFYLTMGSFAIWFSIDLLTWLINFPVNKQAAKWNPSQPPVANWSALRDRWHLGQILRTFLAADAERLHLLRIHERLQLDGARGEHVNMTRE